jgi:hypothetical protein
LTDEEFSRLRQHGRRVVTPLRALLARLRAARGVAARIPGAPPAVLAGLDDAIRATEAAADSSRRIARLADFRRRSRSASRSGTQVARKPAPEAAWKYESTGVDFAR